MSGLLSITCCGRCRSSGGFYAFSIYCRDAVTHDTGVSQGISRGTSANYPGTAFTTIDWFCSAGFLCPMIFLNVGFRVYYAGIYRGWENDKG